MKTNTPKHKLVYETIRKNIESGIYEVDTLLPSENEMCAIFKVTRPTIRQALTRLENDGFIKRHHGKGSIVQEIPHGIGLLSIQGVTQAIGSQGNLSTQILKKPVIEPWPEDFMYDLSDEEKSLGCISMRRLRLIDDSPVMMERTYLVNAHLPRFCQKKYENRSLFDTLRKNYDITITGGKQKIRAIAANAQIAKTLKISKGDPILNMARSIETSKIGLRLFSDIFCYTDTYNINGTF